MGRRYRRGGTPRDARAGLRISLSMRIGPSFRRTMGTTLLLHGVVGAVPIPVPAQVARIPFELHRNKILVPVTLNGAGPFPFILDTGAPITVLGSFALTDSLGIETSGSVRVGGAGAGERPRASLAEVRPGIGSVELGPERAVVMDIVASLAESAGREYMGVIGRTLFQRYIVRLDFGARELVLFDPEAFRIPEGALTVPIRLAGGHPHLDARIQLESGREIALALVLDTGGPSAVAPSDGAVEMVVGRGVRGIVRGRMGRVAGLVLGSVTLRDVATAFAPDSLGVTPGADGNLGVEALRRFDVTIDYPGQRVLLEPTDRVAEPYRLDLSGITLRASGPGWTMLEVMEVRPGSPAARSGVEAGDRIASVDGKPARSLETLETRLTTPGPVRLSLNRNGVVLEVRFELGVAP